jgi:hypothetical protein
MHKKIQHIVATLLLVFFLTPTVIQIADTVFHHHEHLICNAKSEKHVHQYKKECAISSFTFSTFIDNKPYAIFTPNVKTPFILENFYTKNHTLFENYLFLLRAPPAV